MIGKAHMHTYPHDGRTRMVARAALTQAGGECQSLNQTKFDPEDTVRSFKVRGFFCNEVRGAQSSRSSRPRVGFTPRA
jgi:hypothetical protein